MSVSTDLAAIKIIADTTQEQSTSAVLQRAVKNLVDNVTYIHYAAWYEGNTEKVAIAADSNDTYAGTLSFPVSQNEGEEEIGTLVVATKESVAFDVTDLNTLQKVADYIGKWKNVH
ncbi:GAF domain-containing protein [Salicibibacter kimchii]|uniref:GAF domain-containing protein n=1 Tax=Salicibibacter kimchii TaxID=2099786 RepID=A0A345C352_9BACI|nr:GAF domain-containing protein [Salicibibacter kimchii]AXF57633.1 GAF domain-containing protein [Salicibibacter kimchii]